MVKDIKISVRQFTVFVILYSIGTAILIIPSPLAAIAKQDAWIAAILGVGVGLLLVLLYNAVGNIYPDLTLTQKSEKLLGRWLGKTVSITFIFFSFITASELLYYLGEFITTQFMPETPIQAINILFVIVVIMGIRLGLETLARSAEVFFPLFVVLFVFLVFFISPQVDFHNIQPVLESGMKPMIRSTLLFISIFSLPAIVMLMMIPVSVNQPKEARKAFLIGTLIGGIFLIIIIVLAILVLGAGITGRQTYPSYVIAKKINIANFMRIEAIMAGMWFITIYYKMTILFYSSIVGLAQTLNLKDYRSLILPLGLLMVVLSLIVHPDVVHSNNYNLGPWIPYALTYGLLLPLLLLVAYAFRKMFQKK